MANLAYIFTMRTKLCSYAFVFGALFLASNCLAQKVPVILEGSTTLNDDQTAIRFSTSLSDEIQLSSGFYLWKIEKNGALPPNGVRITVRSIKIKLRNGSETGSAIFVEAERPSGKDPGYYKVITELLSMIPKDGSVADETRSFLAAVARALER